jgi:hypothetical protein
MQWPGTMHWPGRFDLLEPGERLAQAARSLNVIVPLKMMWMGAHAHGPELPTAPARAREGPDPSGDLEGRIYTRTLRYAALGVRMGEDRPVVEDERARLIADVAGPTQ